VKKGEKFTVLSPGLNTKRKPQKRNSRARRLEEKRENVEYLLEKGFCQEVAEKKRSGKSNKRGLESNSSQTGKVPRNPALKRTSSIRDPSSLVENALEVEIKKAWEKGNIKRGKRLHKQEGEKKGPGWT